MQIPDDKILLQLFRDGHRDRALDGFYRRYAHLVYGVCLKYLKNRDNSLDATSEIFATLNDKIEKYKIENFNSWVYTLSKNYCLMILRKKPREISIPFENQNTKEANNENFNERDYLALEQAILNLSDEQQQCIRLFYFEKKRYSDIAKITGYNEKNVKSYLQNGRNKLKNILKNK